MGRGASVGAKMTPVHKKEIKIRPLGWLLDAKNVILNLEIDRGVPQMCQIIILNHF